MYKNITASGAALIKAGRARKVRIQVNKALTGNIVLADSNSSGTVTPVVATITDPTVGGVYEYWDLQTGVVINPSATTDITVNVDGSNGPH